MNWNELLGGLIKISPLAIIQYLIFVDINDVKTKNKPMTMFPSDFTCI